MSNHNPTGNAFNFAGIKVAAIAKQLETLAKENARRIPCDRCALTILPENMGRHLRIVHDEGDI